MQRFTSVPASEGTVSALEKSMDTNHVSGMVLVITVFSEKENQEEQKLVD